MTDPFTSDPFTSDPDTTDTDTFFEAEFPDASTSVARDRLRALWGRPLHPDVERLCAATFRDERDPAEHGSARAWGAWRLGKGAEPSWALSDGNPIAKLVASRDEVVGVSRDEEPNVHLWELLTNAQAIGSTEDDILFASLPVDEPLACDLFTVARDRFGFEEPEHVAASVRHFVHVCARLAGGARARERDKADHFERACRGAKGLVNVRHRGFVPPPTAATEDETPARATPYHYFAWRGRWLYYLLKATPDVRASAIAFEEIMKNANAPDPKSVLTRANLEAAASPLRMIPMAAAYWTFHFYFTGDEAGLRAVADAAGKSNVTLVRELARFAKGCGSERAAEGSPFAALARTREAFEARIAR